MPIDPYYNLGEFQGMNLPGRPAAGSPLPVQGTPYFPQGAMGALIAAATGASGVSPSVPQYMGPPIQNALTGQTMGYSMPSSPIDMSIPPSLFAMMQRYRPGSAEYEYLAGMARNIGMDAMRNRNAGLGIGSQVGARGVGGQYGGTTWQSHIGDAPANVFDKLLWARQHYGGGGGVGAASPNTGGTT